MKHKNIIITLVMAAFLLGVSAFAWLKPADSFSDSERRRLAAFPRLSVSSLLSGKFMSDFETYTLDQFPMRDELRSLKALTSLYVFNNSDNNDIYLADGYASKIDYPLNEEALSRAAQRFEYVYEKYLKDSGAKIYFSIIPDKNYFMAEENGYLALDYQRLFSLMQEQTAFMEYIPIAQLLELSDYYKTDTHWRQEALLPVAEALLSAMGGELDAEFQELTLDRDFYGVYRGQSALPLPAEEIHYLNNEILDEAQVYDHQNGKAVSVYDMDKGMGRDPYEFFLSGPLSLVTVDNPRSSSGRELIIFRDSFGSSIAPLLIPAYDKITLVDIRYIHPDLLGKYIDFNNQDVLFLYSSMVLNNSETIK